jgi:hypothetical protein
MMANQVTQDGGISFFADPGCRRPGEIYRSQGRRGTYFRGPSGHLMEILTAGRPSGLRLRGRS